MLLKQMFKKWEGVLIWEECYPKKAEQGPFKDSNQEWVVEWLSDKAKRKIKFLYPQRGEKARESRIPMPSRCPRV